MIYLVLDYIYLCQLSSVQLKSAWLTRNSSQTSDIFMLFSRAYSFHLFEPLENFFVQRSLLRNWNLTSRGEKV